MNSFKSSPATQDSWQTLKQFTSARIALGRAGMSLPTQACLDFQLAHALARDAVHIPLDFISLSHRLGALGHPVQTLHSQAENQTMYLQRPDLGRLLSTESIADLKKQAALAVDAVVVIADGLSSKAIANHADRNCISNIHDKGLRYEQALKKLLFLIHEAEKLKFSGVNLKDETTDNALDNIESGSFSLT
jgi:ethanolamine ammonia-lyase small subunit